MAKVHLLRLMTLTMADGRLEDSSPHHSEELLTILGQIHGSVSV